MLQYFMKLSLKHFGIIIATASVMSGALGGALIALHEQDNIAAKTTIHKNIELLGVPPTYILPPVVSLKTVPSDLFYALQLSPEQKISGMMARNMIHLDNIELWHHMQDHIRKTIQHRPKLISGLPQLMSFYELQLFHAEDFLQEEQYRYFSKNMSKWIDLSTLSQEQQYSILAQLSEESIHLELN